MPDQPNIKLSVIIPAYNEENTLARTVKGFLGYLKKQAYDFEIIIVNDGSADRTAAVARELEKRCPGVRLIDNKTNRGKGAAVRQGLLGARGDYRLFIDADNATSIDHLDLAWPLFEQGYDAVIGSRNRRDAPETLIELPQPGWKRFLGRAGNLLVQRLAVPGIWDTQCGFKVFTAAFVKDIIPRTVIDRWALDAEILALAQKVGYRIGIIPVKWYNGRDSRVGIKGYLLTLREVWRVNRRLRKGVYNKARNKY